MYDKQKQQLRQLEDRNFELEKKFADVTKMNLEAQKIERELRDELASELKTVSCHVGVSVGPPPPTALHSCPTTARL